MRLMLVSGAAGVLLALSAGCPAIAASAQTVSGTSVASEISAQKKKKVTVRHYHRNRHAGYRYADDPTRSPYYLRPGVAPSFGYIGPPGYAGEYAWRRSIGQCVEDLGYGRWAACGSR